VSGHEGSTLFQTNTMHVTPKKSSINYLDINTTNLKRSPVKRSLRFSPKSDHPSMKRISHRRLCPKCIHVTKSNHRTGKKYGKECSTTYSTEGPNESQTIMKSHLKARRIISIEALEKILLAASFHGKTCPRPNLKLSKDVNVGLVSLFTMTCTVCDYEDCFRNDNEQLGLKLNDAAIWATNATGVSFTQIEHCMNALEIPFIYHRNFRKHEKKFQEELREICDDQLKKNGKEERKLAVELGQVDSDHVAWTDVYGDGQWSKRSYRQKGTALSGSAVLIGQLTKNPLFVGIRNKFCITCKLNPENKHDCFRNWVGSSSSMEPDIIMEGFKKSIEMHGLKRFKVQRICR
jgi:hypothetical protein